MGEYSKRIGQIGENVVEDFLKMIGWTNLQKNFDIKSINPEKHLKGSHGIDAFFHYRSPMVSGLIENVIISSKYSTKSYSTNPIKDFKDYYFDLATAIESFKLSEMRQKTMVNHEGYDNYVDRGVLFWLNNSEESYDDLISKLAHIDLPKDLSNEGIFLVDNKRIVFIYDSIRFALSTFRDSDVDFIYFSTGLNNDETNFRNGKIMPIQYINASILPIRIQKQAETIVLISSINEFDEGELLKIMGLAKNIGCNVQGSTILCFPDYSESKHEPIVSNLKQAFNDSSFTNRLTVSNYNSPILR